MAGTYYNRNIFMQLNIAQGQACIERLNVATI